MDTVSPDTTAEDHLQTRLLASYVPKILLKQFQLKPEAVKIPEIDIIRAAVIFADISGFTPLTEKMNKRGKTGIELMTMHLNRFFDKLIGIIHLYGGDIIKFAGDAVMVIWPDDIVGSRLSKNVNLACQCAMEMEAQLHNFECEGVILRLHIGIGCGKLGLVHVGGESGCKEFLITGDPLRQVGDCEKAANPGEVYISREAATLVENNVIYVGKKGKKVRFEKLDEDQKEIMLVGVANPEPPRPSDELPEHYSPLIKSCLLPYISKAVTFRLSQHSSTLDVCAMRLITVVFVNLDFIYVRGLKELHLLQQAVASMQRDIFQFDGAIRQFLIDDKGSVMIGVFGTPPCAHENDTTRAIMASIQLQGNLKRCLGLDCRIGITTGYAFVGDVGNQERREYAMVGDIVNLSARLMGKCELGSILVDKATYLGSAGNHRISFEALPPIMVKGKTTEIEIFRPSQENPSGFSVFTSNTTLPKMIGRKEQLKKLMQVVKSVKVSGNTGIAIIEGEAGLGKTLLVRHCLFKMGTSDDKILILESSGDSVEQKTPYYPWRGIFSTILQLFRFTETDPNMYRKAVKDWLAANLPHCAPLYPLLGDIYPTLVCEDTPETSDHDSKRTQKLVHLLTEIIKIGNGSDNTTTISLDNLQWFDRASWTLLVDLIVRCPKSICFILCLRPMPFRPAEFKRIKKKDSCTFFQLKEMKECDLVEIVRQRLNVTVMPPVLETLLISKLVQYPNPLLAQETADQLKEKGLVLTDEITGEGKVNLGLLAAGNTILSQIVPSSLHGIFTAKIDHLMSYEQLVLKYAAVIGRVFSVALLENILPIPAAFLAANKKDHVPEGQTPRHPTLDANHFTRNHLGAHHTGIAHSHTHSGGLPQLNMVMHQDQITLSEGASAPGIHLLQDPKAHNKTKRRSFESDAIQGSKTRISAESLDTKPLGPKRRSTESESIGSESGTNRRHSSRPPRGRRDLSAEGSSSVGGSSSPRGAGEHSGCESSKEQHRGSSRHPRKRDRGGNEEIRDKKVATRKPVLLDLTQSTDDDERPKRNTRSPSGRTTQLDLFNYMFGNTVPEEKEVESSKEEVINEVTIGENWEAPKANPPRPNQNMVLTQRDVFDYILKGGTIEQLVAEKATEDTRAQKSLELQKITRKFQQNQKISHITQQDMFNYMFGEGQISSLIHDDDEKAFEELEEPKTTTPGSEVEGDNCPDPEQNDQNDKNFGSSHSGFFNSPAGGDLANRPNDSLKDSFDGPNESGNPPGTDSNNSNNSDSPKQKNSNPDTPDTKQNSSPSEEQTGSESTQTDRSPSLARVKSRSVQDISKPKSVRRPASPPTVIVNSSLPKTPTDKGRGTLTLSSDSPVVPRAMSATSPLTARAHLGRNKTETTTPTREKGLRSTVGGDAVIPSPTPKIEQKIVKERKRSRRMSDSDTVREGLQKLEKRKKKAQQLTKAPASPVPGHLALKTPTSPDTQHLITILKTLKDHVEETENPFFFQFRHTVFRKVFVETMLPSKLPAIHTKIAEFLELNPESCPPPAVKHLAYHWRKAHRPDKAIVYYSQLVETAMREFLHRKATKLLLKTIRLQETLSSTPALSESRELRPEIAISNLEKWHRQLGETFYNLGEFEKAQFHLSKALEVTQQGFPEQEQYLVFPLLEHLEQTHWSDTSKGAHGKEAKSTKTKIKRSQASSPSEMVRIFLCFAQVYYYRSNATSLGSFGLHALSIAEGLGLGSSELCRALASNVLSASVYGKNEQMIQHYSRLGQSLFKEAWTRRAWLLEGIARSGLAEWTEANLLLNQAFKHSEEVGDTRTVEECALHLSFNHFFMGDFVKAQQLAEQSFQTACAKGDLQMQVMSLLASANLAYSSGKIEIFFNHMQNIQVYFGAGIKYQMTETDQILYYGLRAIKHLKEKEEKQALQTALLIDQLFESRDVQPTVWWSVLGLYYSFLVKAIAFKSSGSSKQATEKTGMKQKKLVQNLLNSLKKLEEFSTKFKPSSALYFIAAGIFDHCNGKKTQNFVNAVGLGTTYQLKYFTAIAHHWITVFITISDNAQTKTRVNHLTCASNLFTEMDVYETMLVWIN